MKCRVPDCPYNASREQNSEACFPHTIMLGLPLADPEEAEASIARNNQFFAFGQRLASLSPRQQITLPPPAWWNARSN